jgi:hypothetical protein
MPLLKEAFSQLSKNAHHAPGKTIALFIQLKSKLFLNCGFL